MRTATDPITGIVVTYPDYMAFAFNPVLITAEGATDGLVVDVSANGVVREASVASFGNDAHADVQEYCQAFFDGMDLSVDYASNKSLTDMGMTLYFDARATAGNDTFTVSFQCFVVWGALKPCGEEFQPMRRLMWFKNYPFTFGLYAQMGETVMFGYNGAPVTYETIAADGLYNFSSANLPQGAKYHVIYSYNGTIQQATFDNTFDLTFWLDNNGIQTEMLRIDYCDCDEGVYLRWIDRHGFWVHWLFKPGDEQRTIAALREFSRNALTNYDINYGWQRGAGRRQAMSRGDVIPVCAPLVDSDTFDILQDVTSSPVVDIYCGDDANNVPQWVGVGIQAATYTKKRDELQDFVMNVILPETPIQSL